MLAATLDKVVSGEIKRLIVEIPPRHSKSVHVSELLPAYALGHDPDKRIILASYASGLAAAFSRRVRNTIADTRYGRLFPTTRLAVDSRAAGAWDISGRAGGLIAAGVGSGITGHGADLLIIDDPVKDRKEAESVTRRQDVWDWYTSTARTRLHPGGAVIICQTRWHHDDLAGRLIDGQDEDDDHADEWTVLKFPAIATDEDDLGRQVGEPLWPERYTLDDLLRIKRDVGTRDWIALYQQEPSDEEGAIFPIGGWHFYETETMDFNSRFRNFQLLDTAYKDGQQNDYSVIATWTRSPDGILYARDWVQVRLQYPALKKVIKAQYDKWMPDRVHIEDKASGITLLQDLRALGIPLAAYQPDGDKVVRAHAVTPFIESGRMLLPDAHPMLSDFLQEHAKFPAGAHDDMVDTTSMAGIILARRDEPMPTLEIAGKTSRW
tara:strand:- start:118 stop:1425 length:1308 start_codon:yes stop_codon:yes gene_type:complete